MLGWLSGAGQRAGSQAPKDTDNGNLSYIDEVPETPAPIFAVRAIKTALFGTPHPNQSDEAMEQKASPEKASKSKHSPQAKILTSKIGTKSYAARTQSSTPLMSPAKGILVTPGTAAGRRKTVSFGGLVMVDNDTLAKPQDNPAANIEKSKEILVADPLEETEIQYQSQPTLTKELFEAQLDASKQRLNAHERPTETSLSVKPPLGEIKQRGLQPVQSAMLETTLDFTVDLTKPRSQSGQHWKAEFERYQKNSDRELKKIIQHGQNVKSYAEKKDVEATNLHEKLKRELSKCAAMEIKVSKLATQLANSKVHGAEGWKDQAKLMNDLSRQTALAVRYKQKAERYRIAIKQQTSSALGVTYDENHNKTENLSADITHAADFEMNSDDNGGRSELDVLRGELYTLRSKLNLAEQKAAKLEVANVKLMKNFLRVKDEMENYDARRVRKETSLKKREETLVAEKKVYERKLQQLTKEHTELLRSVENGPEADTYDTLSPSDPRRQSLNRNRVVSLPGPGSGLDQRNDPSDSDTRQPSNIRVAAPLSHSVNNAHRGTAIDIWTMDSPNDTTNMAPPAAEPAINLSHLALSEATSNALREIDSNSVSDIPSEPHLPPDTPRPTLGHLAKMDSALQPDFPSSDADLSSAVKRMNERRNIIASPRPSMVNMASSVMKGDTPGASRRQRNASFVSTAGSRKSALNGGKRRVGELPPDRAAAAKARLAQKRSTKENRYG
ncbi:MAG: hypothetical protein Q9184_000187 [Pyrenodesmia sp. 2 TL-2023]